MFVTNTAANPVPVSGSMAVSNLPDTQAVSGTVSVSNLPAAPSTTVIGSGTVVLGMDVSGDIIADTDVRAYRDVAVYLHTSGGSIDTSGTCQLFTSDPEGDDFRFDIIFPRSNDEVARSYTPAPPNIRMHCENPDFTGVTYRWMLTGRGG